MLIDELRRTAKIAQDKKEVKRKKLIKKYEIRITNALRIKTRLTGDINVKVKIPKEIADEIIKIFRKQGLSVRGLYSDDISPNMMLLRIRDKQEDEE